MGLFGFVVTLGLLVWAYRNGKRSGSRAGFAAGRRKSRRHG